jgi:hypothetical protein
MVHDSKQTALAVLPLAFVSTATQVPPYCTQTCVFIVQSTVQIPLPTPPGLAGLPDKLSLDLTHVRPKAQSPFDWQAAPNFEFPGGPASGTPDLPPDPAAPPVPPPRPPVPVVALDPPLVLDELDELLVVALLDEPLVVATALDDPTVIDVDPPAPTVVGWKLSQ